ncbi:hypothetical protein LOAG_11137 [Loa loa]|uniref:Uncharacterized protein n=1 Tax=Loa loa TaxID=7209 RepID=A0A1S0TNJ7_LOALO|nr:hypothetical protein LOAG_11137 [Loa loa]EFO17362.1 hypothetical protein LOAG_11137 [Loa loa]
MLLGINAKIVHHYARLIFRLNNGSLSAKFRPGTEMEVAFDPAVDHKGSQTTIALCFCAYMRSLFLRQFYNVTECLPVIFEGSNLYSNKLDLLHSCCPRQNENISSELWIKYVRGEQ